MGDLQLYEELARHLDQGGYWEPQISNSHHRNLEILLKKQYIAFAPNNASLSPPHNPPTPRCSRRPAPLPWVIDKLY